MKKKTRPAGGTVGRRTIIQLSPSGVRSGNTGERDEGLSGSEEEQEGEGQRFTRSRTNNMKAPNVKATEGLSLLGAYADSDEEDATEARPTTTSQHKPGDIDSTLANFMAEIDAITTQPSSEDTTGQPDNSSKVEAKQSGTSVGQLAFNTQYSLATVGVEMGDWQEVWEDNTGCHYYWNTQTNEVLWELPNYLADQVQRLAQQANSLSVNGNGTSSNSAPAAAPTSTQETKVKELMESVVGLTSKEEERCGVAASLLAPIIPAEVKDAEEKWRKKLLKGLDEAGASLDSDGEGGRAAGSPAPPMPDSGAPATAEKDSDGKKPSGENSDAEGGPEEDTVELEMVLERKKAELQALEEGEGSAGGSSPCSETSQDASGSRSAARKKRWKSVFPSAPSPESNSRGSETQENTQTESVGGEDNGEKDDGEQKGDAPPKEELETPELRFQIGELANTLTSKMEFLGIHKKAVSNFQLLLLQTETRIADWREGALNGVYLRRRLQEAAEHIKHYELNAAPKGWSCHWDREHRRYFYVNELTNSSQWEFPTEEAKGNPETSADGQTASPSDDGASGTPVCAPAAPPASPRSGKACSPPRPPLPDSPPPPPELPPLPPDSPPPPPPPPPPDSDGEIMEVEMEMDEETDLEPPAPGTEDDDSEWPLSNVLKEQVPEASCPPGKGQKRKAGQLNKAVIGSSPILYTQHVATTASVVTAPVYWGVPAAASAPLVPCEAPIPAPQPPPPPQPQPPVEQPKAATVEKTKKTKKDKKAKTKMPSLVKKWQSIQKELEEEEKSSSSDEDREQLSKKGIEDWRQQQLITGKANKNANFEALPDNWRDRLKKRKLNTT
ncbi:formin-binding protein 4 isoform X2 [Stigmatopora argus]